MTAPVYHDGIYHAARRNYTPSQRSWHVPAETRRVGRWIIITAQLVVCAVPVALFWWVLS